MEIISSTVLGGNGLEALLLLLLGESDSCTRVIKVLVLGKEDALDFNDHVLMKAGVHHRQLHVQLVKLFQTLR